MELSHLRYFSHVATARSFSKGAVRAHVSPAAISKAIRLLEQELGAALFVRTTRHVALTETGEMVLKRCQRIFEEVDGLEGDLQEASGEITGELRIAAMEVFSVHLLPSALARFMHQNPKVTPRVYEMIPQEMERHIADGSLDLGFTIGGGDHPSVDYELLGRSPGRLVCGRRHSLYRIGKVRPAEFSDLPFVIPRFFQRDHLAPLDQFPEDRYPRRLGATVELLQMAIQLVIEGDALGYFPEISIKPQLHTRALKVLGGLRPGPPFELRALTRKGVRPRRATRLLISELGSLS